ncbi:hypothetical protein BCR42DRAFT_441508 [Absidia repens]|uniref:Uncharacterized protein n=1 Tax=Absidia repens TaxID=90262 RepID=A0A1X2I603_9FUNG|nr:hypothetical protein BCR42DRAFT_441508 [Absidia repens]
MKVLIFITICLTLFTLVQSIEENEENQPLTVYKTVTAPANTDKLQSPTASSASEQVKPTLSLEAEDESTASSTLENKSAEPSVNEEKSIHLNDGATSSPVPDTEVEVETEEEEEEEKDANKPMKLTPEVSSEKDGASDKESSLVSEGPSKSVLSGSASASASKQMSSSSSAKSYNSAFSFSPITLAPESTKAAGAKATAPIMNKASAKTGTVKTDKHVSSGFKVTPSSSFILFVLALIL